MTPASSTLVTVSLLKDLAAAGFSVPVDDAVFETVSGSVAASNRKEWQWLFDRMHEGDGLIVPGLDSLGRDVQDQCATVTLLADKGVRVHCLALGRVDLTGPAGKATMDVLRAVARSEQVLLSERERLGRGASKVDMTLVKRKGRPRSLMPAQVAEARRLLAAHFSVAEVAKRLATSRQTIMRVRARDTKDVTTKPAVLLPGAR
jgi:putative DNA-invertase from lambdoid prophage Rac